MRSVFIIAAKDLRLRVRDRSAFLMGIVAPFMLAFILNIVLVDLVDDDADFSASYGVVDEDGGTMGANLVGVLDNLDSADLEVATGLSEDQARDEVGGSLDAAFVIPAGFSEAVSSPAEGAEIGVIGDVDAQIATQLATAIADGFADRVTMVRLSVATAGAVGSPQGVAELAGEAAQQDLPVRVADVEADTRELDGATYVIAGVGVLFLFLLVRYGATGLLDEQREGTMARLLAAPIARSAIPAAKALSTVVLCLVSLGTLIVTSTLVMGAHWGPPAAVALLGLGAALAATSVMGVVAAVAKTPEQAAQAQAMIAMLLAIVGGSFFPVSEAGGFVQTVSQLTPHHWFLRGLGEASAGGLEAALPAFGALVAFALLFGTIAALLVPRMLER